MSIYQRQYAAYQQTFIIYQRFLITYQRQCFAYQHFLRLISRAKTHALFLLGCFANLFYLKYFILFETQYEQSVGFDRLKGYFQQPP